MSSRRRCMFPTDIFSLTRALPFSLKKYVPSRTENHEYHHCWRKKLEQLCFYFHALWLSILGRIEFTYFVCLNSEVC
uniref:Uncharacterized protein n=1 Tax=Triticum urartu TaxID=4572 RepID=A0A8R7TZC9_TRIUA